MAGSILMTHAAPPLRRRQFRQHFILAFFLVLLLSTGRPGACAAGEIALLAPPLTDLVMLSRNKLISVVVKVADPADLDRLGLQDDKSKRAFDPVGRHLKNGVYYVHYQLPLKKGANSFTLAPVGRTLTIRYTPLSSLLNVNLQDPGVYLFHRQGAIPGECAGCHTEQLPADANIDLVRYGQFSPECFSCHRSTAVGAEWRHFPSSALLCRTCHSVAGNATQVVVPTGKIESLCFDCHVNEKKWATMRHIHGPVGTGDCTICHDPHGSSQEFQLWAEGKTRLCVVCHEGMKKFLDPSQRNFQIHGILNAQGCVACHSPHATDHRFQLYREINELCVSCHTGMQARESGHPVQKHPVQGKKDPLRVGSPFSCTSCHNPHGSPYRYLLIGDVRGGLICLKCHDGQQP